MKAVSRVVIISISFASLCTNLIAETNGEVLYYDGFEDPDSQWTIDNGVWEIGVPSTGGTHSGSNVAATNLSGGYPQYTASRLVTPQIQLTAVAGSECLQIRFFQRYTYSNGSGQIQVSEWSGAGWGPWVAVAESGGAFTSSGWSSVAVDITAYAGKTVRIGFYHTSGFYTNLGWYIDDVEIWKGVPAFHNPETFENGWGDWSTDNGVWAIGKPTVGPGNGYNSNQCAGTGLTGNYPQYTASRLISPQIQLTAVASGERLQIRFFHCYAYNSGSGQVQVSEWSGGSWGSWVAVAQPVVSDTSSGWSSVAVDITAYAGKTVRIGFYHTSGFYTNLGWYIDDVEIWKGVPAFHNPETFENGWGDWSTDNGVWAIGKPTVGPGNGYNSNQCAGTGLTGNYPQYTASRLISPALKLPATQTDEGVQISFFQWYVYTNGSGQVQVSEWSGGSWGPWVTVAQPAASGTSNGWLFVTADITAYAGKTVRIGFYHTSGFYTNFGWYIDDLRIWHGVLRRVSPLLLNRLNMGLLENPCSVDNWNFSANAGIQIRFDLVNRSNSNIVFDLVGPAGFAGGFTDLQTDSNLITLDESGTYTLVVRNTDGQQYGGSYAFQIQQTSVTDLALGTVYDGNLVSSAQAELFRVHVPESHPMLVVLDDDAGDNCDELYIKFGMPPTRGNYDYRYTNLAAQYQEILVPMAYAGDWYILVYGDKIVRSSSYTLLARTSDVFLKSITPDHHGRNADTVLTLTGAGFEPNIIVDLVDSNTAAPFQANTTVVDSQTQITATFAANTVPEGVYNVKVSKPGGDSDELLNALAMTAQGSPKLETNLIVPANVGRHALATLYVEYTNTGEVAMAAPLLVLDAKQDRAFLTLDRSRITQGFWTSALPEGFSDTVQFLASGSQPGILNPGERGKIPIYYAGLQTPWNFADTSVEFNLGVLDSSNALAVDWGQIKDTMRPDYVRPDAWDAIWANFTSSIGNTWGGYLAMLDENAAFLDRLGGGTNEITRLLAFEMRQADGLNPIRYLASATDAIALSPGIAVVFSRSYAQPISRRFELGPLGRGWTHQWQWTLKTEPDGKVQITDPTGTPRIFQPDSRHSGQYLAATGDYGKLSLSGGTYTVREQDGTVTAYRSDGKLDYVQNANGNRITCGYVGNLLTNLTASAGQSLQITYNSADRISTVTDPHGRQVFLTYDVANEHLISARDYDGRTTAYSYITGQGITREHALNQITYSDGTHRYFNYDAQGRLASTYIDGGAEPTTFSYNSAGTVTATDALDNLSGFFFDDWGQILKATNALGNSVTMTLDDKRNLTAVTDPAGHTYSFAYDNQGNVIRLIDTIGAATNFTYTSSFNQLATLTDAKGNLTRYGYDAKGNLTAITYADGSEEHWTYDSMGQVTQWTNRRGSSVDVTWDFDGRITSKTYADGNHIDYAFDSRGNLIGATNINGVITYTYDANDYFTRIDYPDGQWLAFTYDTGRRRASSTDQLCHELIYNYDIAGRLSSITDETDAQVVVYQYDNVGRFLRKTLGNGVYTTYQYDSAGQLLHLVNCQSNGSELSRFDYTYDSRGRRTSMNTSYGLWTYQYDDMGQLTRAVLASTNPSVPSQELTYVYDALGNRIYTVENGIRTDYTTNNLNQYTTTVSSVNGQTNYTFDADGSLISETSPAGATIYSYDDENRLIAVQKDSDSWMYQYDALGQRIQTNHSGAVMNYVIDPAGLGNVVGEYDGSGNLVAHCDHGFGLLSRTNPTDDSVWYTFDALGGTSELTDAAEGIVNDCVYCPFGATLYQRGSVPNSFQYVGKLGVLNEDNGLNFMRARYYRTDWGRFVQSDPIGIAAGFNLYGYCENNPVSWVDPIGLAADCYDMPPGVAKVDSQGKIHLPQDSTTVSDAVKWVEEFHRGPQRKIWKFLGLSWPTRNDATGAMWVEVTAHGAGWIWAIRHGDKRGRDENWEYSRRWLNDPEGMLKSTQSPENQPKGSGCKWSTKPVNPFVPPTDQLPSSSSATSGSLDPNKKMGPQGYGSRGFIQSGSLIPYRIDFENDANATAPAQVVEIRDPLDPNLDWNTFELTEIAFGDRAITVPDNTQHFETAMPISSNDVDFEVQIEAGIELDTGKVYAKFYSVDPCTSLPPTVDIGFLPPEDGNGIGMGHISFVVNAKEDLPTGTTIRNVAHITFDFAETIATNQIDPHDFVKGTDPNLECLNTIDSGVPATSIQSLPPSSMSPFTVQWTGQDDTGGSGIANYEIYVSADGEAYTLWQTTSITSATYSGELGRTYSFYVIAVDNAGNRELVAQSDTSTQVDAVYSGSPDIDGDGSVDLEDLGILAQNWLCQGCAITGDWCGRTDLDISGAVDLDDFAILAEQWEPNDAFAGDPDMNGDGDVDSQDLEILVQNWLRQDCAATGNWCSRTDLDVSGTVDFADFATFALDWMEDFE